MFYQTTYSSPVGRLTLASDGESLTGLWLENQKYFAENFPETWNSNHHLSVFKATKKWLDDYFDGAIKTTSSSTIKVIDFNVIWKKSLAGIEVKILDFSKNTKIDLRNGEYFILSLEENGKIVLFNDKLDLSKGDFIKINLLDTGIEVEGKFIFVKI